MPSSGPSPLKFARGVTNAQLDAARAVALTAAGGDIDAARLISKGQFNNARAAAGYPDLITGERLRQKLRAPHWHGALAIAFLGPEQRSAAIGSYQKRVSALSQGADIPKLRATPAEREVIADLLTELVPQDAPETLEEEPVRIATGVTLASPDVLAAIITRALRATAFRVGHAPTAVACDDMIHQMEWERDQAGLPPLGFPDSKTIIGRVGSWAKAAEDAELPPPPSHTRPKGLPVVDVLDEYIERHDVVPGLDCFRRSTSCCSLSVGHRRTDTWDVIVEETRAKRAERGASTPTEIVRRKPDWPPLPSAEEAAAVKEKLGGPPRIRGPRTAEDAVEGIRIYAREHLRDGQRPTQRHYLGACKRDSRLVWPSKLRGITGRTFTQMCADEGL